MAYLKSLKLGQDIYITFERTIINQFIYVISVANIPFLETRNMISSVIFESLYQILVEFLYLLCI